MTALGNGRRSLLESASMRLLIHPRPSLPLLLEDLELAITVTEAGIPECYVSGGHPRPDRHLLVGIAQTMVVSMTEEDDESIVIDPGCQVALQRGDETRRLDPGLIIVRTLDGRLGAISVSDAPTATKLIRQALRYFTGTVRLDVP